MSKNDPGNDWFTCPICGEVVDAKALACPHCGADDETGWSEDAAYDEVDLPDEAFGEFEPKTMNANTLWFRATAALLIGLIVLFVLSRIW